MINISWNDFDKAFWLTANNIRRLIQNSITISIEVGNVENKVSKVEQDVTIQQTQINQVYQNYNNLNTTTNLVSGDVAQLRRELNAFTSGYDLDYKYLDGLIRDLQARVDALERG